MNHPHARPRHAHRCNANAPPNPQKPHPPNPPTPHPHQSTTTSPNYSTPHHNVGAPTSPNPEAPSSTAPTTSPTSRRRRIKTPTRKPRGKDPHLAASPERCEPTTGPTQDEHLDALIEAEHDEVRMITAPQLTKLSILLRENGLTDRDSRHDFVTAAIGRHIDTAKQLTMD